MDETSGVALDLKTGVPSYQVEDEEGRVHLLIHLPIEEDGDDNRWCLWRPDHVGFDTVRRWSLLCDLCRVESLWPHRIDSAMPELRELQFEVLVWRIW